MKTVSRGKKKPTEVSVEDITLRHIVQWIYENKDDTLAMDQINYLSYPHTGKFKTRYQDRKGRDERDDGIFRG